MRREKIIWRLAASREKALEQGSGFGGEKAGYDLDAMVELGGREDFETGAEGATLGVVGGIYEAWDTGLNDGTGAHSAGLQGYVEGGIG